MSGITVLVLVYLLMIERMMALGGVEKVATAYTLEYYEEDNFVMWFLISATLPYIFFHNWVVLYSLFEDVKESGEQAFKMCRHWYKNVGWTPE